MQKHKTGNRMSQFVFLMFFLIVLLKTPIYRLMFDVSQIKAYQSAIDCCLGPGYDLPLVQY
jgi:hypothetical protein